MSTHDPIQLLITLGMLSSLCYYLASYFGARDFFRKARKLHQSRGDTPLPTVTILKPLKGLEVDLYVNLASFCRQDYPTFEIIFGVADRNDPAVPVVRRLQASFPDVAINLVIDSRLYGTNLKVSNLHNMSRLARHDVIVIADSDIRVPSDYLRRIVPPLQDTKVGIVTCLYRASGKDSVPTMMESLFVNTDFSPSVLVARLVEARRYAFGATIALRRSVLAEVGGFLPLANHLADDYFLGKRVAEHGYDVALSDLVVETVLAAEPWTQLIEHQLRWARTNRSSRPGGYFASVVTYGVLWATLNLLYNQGSGSALFVAVLMYGARMLTASAVAKRYLEAPLRPQEILLIPVKDLFNAVIWALAFLGDTVQWSGNEFRVMKGGEMLRVSPIDAAAAPGLAYSSHKDHEPHAASLHGQNTSRSGSSLHV